MGEMDESGDGEESPAIYLVATPIGNLEDLSPRVRRILGLAQIIAAEDTRKARQLLSHLGIHGKRLVSYQDHGEEGRAASLIASATAERLSIAVITDAGTPCIADPGYRIVAAAHAAGIKVHPIPGPSALTALVSASGLPSDRLLFVGFLPTRATALRQEILGWRSIRASIVFFEAMRRIGRTLAAIREIYPDARVALGRELTKLYEEVVQIPIAEAQAWLAEHPTLRGEVSVMVSPGGDGGRDSVDSGSTEGMRAEIRNELAGGATLKDLLRKYRDVGMSRGELYELLLQLKAERES